MYCFLTWLVMLVWSCFGSFISFKRALIQSNFFRLLVQFIHLSYLTIARLLTISMVLCLCNTVSSHCCSSAWGFPFPFIFLFHSFSASTAWYSRRSSGSGDSFRFKLGFFMLLSNSLLKDDIIIFGSGGQIRDQNTHKTHTRFLFPFGFRELHLLLVFDTISFIADFDLSLASFF